MLTYAETAEMLETIAAALSKSGLHEKAGSFMEKLGMAERALEAYRKGHAYRYLKASYTRSLRPHTLVAEGRLEKLGMAERAPEAYIARARLPVELPIYVDVC